MGLYRLAFVPSLMKERCSTLSGAQWERGGGEDAAGLKEARVCFHGEASRPSGCHWSVLPETACRGQCTLRNEQGFGAATEAPTGRANFHSMFFTGDLMTESEDVSQMRD